MQNRVFWLRHEHFDFKENPAWLEQARFSLQACYDVVAAPDWRIASNVQPWNEIWLVKSGRVEVTLDEQRTVVRAGEVAILQAGQKRDTREAGGAALSILGFSFSATLLDAFEIPSLLCLPPSLKPDADAWEQLETALQNAVAEGRRGQAGFSLAARSWANLAFVRVLRMAFSDEEINRRLQQRLRNALAPEVTKIFDFIARQYGEPIELETLARHVHLSVPHFARKFKEATGTSPMEYLRCFRLEKARLLLLGSDQSVGDIALACGIPDAAYFSRAFKKHFNLAPGEFRKQTRAFGAIKSEAHPS